MWKRRELILRLFFFFGVKRNKNESVSSELLHCDNQSAGLLRRDPNEHTVLHENVALCMRSSYFPCWSTCGIFTLRNRTPNVFGIPAPYCQRVGFLLLEYHRFCILCFPYVFTWRYRWFLTSQILYNRMLCYTHDNNYSFKSSYKRSVFVFTFERKLGFHSLLENCFMIYLVKG